MQTSKAPTEMENFAESLKADSIKIYIGEMTLDSTPYLVPESLLCKHHYFKTALSAPYLESQTRTLRFPEDSKIAWPVLLCYFFGKEVEWSPGPKRDENVLTLTHAYLLADKYGLAELQNKIAKTIMKNSTFYSGFHPPTIKQALSLLPTGCPLRWTLLDIVVQSVMVEGGNSWEEFECLVGVKDVFADLMLCFQEYIEDPTEFPLHEHLSDGAFRMQKYFVKGSKKV